MRNQILQRLIQLVLGIPALDLDMLTIHIELRIDDGLLQILLSGCLILGRFILMIPDDVLYGLRKLRHVALLHILSYLHRLFQGLIVRRLRQHHDSLILRLGHQAKLALLCRVRCDGQDMKPHTAGDRANVGGIDHLVKREVIFPVTIFLRCIDIGKDHLANTLYDGRGIHLCILIDIPLNILLLIGQEIICITGSSDIVLTQQTVEACAHRLSHRDLIDADIICHENDDVVEVCRYIIHITDEVQKL